MLQQKDFEKRFWSNVEIKGLFECWEWMGVIGNRGYGKFSFNGIKESAHRLAYFFVNGTIPKKYHICHHCDNKRCCNPSHLFLGTARDNARDRKIKGRNADQNGEKNHNAKLKNNDIIEILKLIKNGNKIKDIARLYSVYDQKIYDIKNNKIWKAIQR